MLTEQKLVEYVEASSTALTKAAEAEEKRAASAKQCNDVIPRLVDVLLKQELIEPHEKQAALTALTNPVNALLMLEKFALAKQAESSSSLGRPVDQQKRASHNSLTSPHVGGRHVQVRESDRVFLSSLGISAGG